MTASSLDRFIDAGPASQRPGARMLVTLGRRPRGRALLSALPLALVAADSLLAMARYDDPGVARELGYDADAVVARGRRLRADQGRP